MRRHWPDAEWSTSVWRYGIEPREIRMKPCPASPKRCWKRRRAVLVIPSPAIEESP